MAVTITRTAWIDDDGTGTTGTVLNNAVKTSIYNEIDGALAKVAQLVGGNSFTGSQTIAGVLTVTGLGTHSFTGAGVGFNVLQVVNATPGAGNAAQILVGNDTSPFHTALSSFASNYSPTIGYNFADGSTLVGSGAAGLSIVTGAVAPVRFYTNTVERARLASTGELLINLTTSAFGRLSVAFDGNTTNGLGVQNLNAANTGFLQAFYNSAAGLLGSITQSGAAGVLFNTSSDGRLKDDAGPATDVSALRGLVVHDFTWKADGIRDRGIFAQEAAALYPRAVSPGTDETTDTGSLARPWMTDYSKFVPDLIVGWQQHAAELATLRAELATLKGSPDAE